MTKDTALSIENMNHNQESRKNSIKNFLIFIALLILVFIIMKIPDEQKFNPDNLSINKTKLNELKYEIRVDCKWLIENDYDINVNKSKMSEICKGIYPDLIWEEELNGTKD